MEHVRKIAAALALAIAALGSAHAAEEPVLNLYSARHYQTDEALYNDFTKSTGIRINRIEAGDEQLIERLKSEGRNSPADVLLIVDASRLAQAEDLGLFQPVKSKTLEERIPASMRDPDGEWFAFSSRGRILVYNTATVKPADIATYASLADPKHRGKVCARTGSHPYNLSLIASRIAHVGEAKAEEWARGVVANFARKPQGGDTDQIKAVAAGECGVAIANSYYYARLLRSTKPEDAAIVAKTAVVWPDQAGAGTHLNVSGGGRFEERAASRERHPVPRVSRERSGAGLLRGRQQRMADGQGRRGGESRAGENGQVQGGSAADRDAREERRGGAADRGQGGVAMTLLWFPRTRGRRRYRSFARSPCCPILGSLRAAPDSSMSGASPTSTIASDGSAASASRSSRAS